MIVGGKKKTRSKMIVVAELWQDRIEVHSVNKITIDIDRNCAVLKVTTKNGMAKNCKVTIETAAELAAEAQRNLCVAGKSSATKPKPSSKKQGSRSARR